MQDAKATGAPRLTAEQRASPAVPAVVPRSVIVLSSDPDLFDHVRAVVRDDNRFINVSDLVHCDGSAAPLTNIYPAQNDPVDWDGWEPVPGMPDPRTMSALIFECSSAEWVAEVGTLLVHGRRASDVVWDGEEEAILFDNGRDAAQLRDGDLLRIGGESVRGDVPLPDRIVPWVEQPG